MHCIITDNEKIINYAKKQGANVVEVEKSVIIKNEREERYSKITPEIVDRFLTGFPNVRKESLGRKYLKYILENKLGYEDLDGYVYPLLAKKYKKESWRIKSAVLNVYAECITNIPAKYEPFFDKYECSVHWCARYSSEFVKACQEYLDEKGDDLTGERKISSKSVESFLKGFRDLNKNTLGYKCIKYILEKQIDCTGNIQTTVYPLLIKKFDTSIKSLKQSLTYTLNNCRGCMPKKYKEFFTKHNCYSGNGTVEEHNFIFLRACQLYLKTQM